MKYFYLKYTLKNQSLSLEEVEYWLKKRFLNYELCEITIQTNFSKRIDILVSLNRTVDLSSNLSINDEANEILLEWLSTELLEEEKVEEVKNFLLNDKFRIRGRCFLLTYAQTSGIDSELVLTFLNSLNKPIHKYFVFQEEQSADGFHIYAYLEFKKDLDIKNVKVFDIREKKNIFHPTIKKLNPKDFLNTVNSVSKTKKNVLTNILLDKNQEVLFFEKRLVDLAKQNRVMEAMELFEQEMLQNEPDKYLSRYRRIKKVLKEIYQDQLEKEKLEKEKLEKDELERKTK